jgi:peptidoglycan hydrolase CwlO-like protein
MRAVIVLLALGLTGCATSPPSVKTSSAPVSASRPNTNVELATVAHVTRYELGAYRYPAAESDQSETAVLRTTRVPPHLAAQPNVGNVSPAYDPLPASAELSAELSAQREITEQLRAMKAAILAAERKAQEQYGTLVSHTEEVVKLRHQLEVERARVRELEAQLQERLQAQPAPVVASTPSPASTSTEGVKW